MRKPNDPIASADPLKGAWTKLDRVYNQLQWFNTEVETFLRSKPYEVLRELDEATETIYLRCHLKQPCPDLWSVVIGEIARNLRSALDYAVCEATLFQGKAITTMTQFPITQDLAKFPAEQKKRIPDVGSKCIALVKSLQPFSNGGGAAHPLVQLRALSNFDKHRAISVALMSATKTDAWWNSHQAEFSLRTGVNLQDQALLGTIKLKPGPGSFAERVSKLEGQSSFAVELAFEKPDNVGYRVIPILGRIAQFVHEATQRFSDEIFT